MSAPQPLCHQAVILVGGEGTRLRPITSRVPKPVVPMVERPFVGYILENLARHGVRRAVFSTGHLADAIKQAVGDGARYGLRVTYVVEDEPLGTAGAIKHAEGDLDDGCFFAFNGDVLTDVDLTALAAFHRDKGGVGTIYLTPVDDPRAYGLVQIDAAGRVKEFLEKPGADYVGRALINAGVYVLEPAVLEMIPAGRMFSIERGVFPRLAQSGSLYGFPTSDYWRDIGTPDSYLRAHFDILERAVVTSVAEVMGDSYVYVASGVRVDERARIVPPAYLAADVTIAGGAQVGPLAVVGAGSQVGEGALVSEAVVQEGVSIGAHATVQRSVVVRYSSIGAGCLVKEALVGEGCRVGVGNELAHGISLAPGTSLPDGSVVFRDIGDGGESR